MALNTQWANQLASDLVRDFGISKEAALGFTGALAMESEGFTDWTEDAPLVPGSRGGGGMAMWTADRRKAYEAFVEEHGMELDSYEAQYEYLKHELRGNGNHDGDVIRKLSGITDPREAARIVTKEFLRPGIEHMAARYDWTDQVVANYHPVPGGYIQGTPEVATKIDATIPQLPRIAPTPEPRIKGTVARANALGLGLQLPPTPPMPIPRPDRDPTQTQSSTTRSDKFEYTADGKPRDPKTGYLMSPNHPDYNEAMGIKEAPTPRPASERPSQKPTVQARLPELPPPSNTGSLSLVTPLSTSSASAKANRASQAAEQKEQRSAKPMTPIDDPLILYAVQTEAQLNADAQAARDEILASEAAKVEARPRIPGQSIIERNPPKKSTNSSAQSNASKPVPGFTYAGQEGAKSSQKTPTGVTKSAGGIAGTVQLPLDVRPNIPDLTVIAPTLPSGSRPMSYAGQEGAGKKSALAATTANQRGEAKRQKKLGFTYANDTPKAGKKLAGESSGKQKTSKLPELPMETAEPAEPIVSPNQVTESFGLNDVVQIATNLFDFGFGGESEKSKPAGYARPENNAAGGVGAYNYKPASGYGSKGYTSIESDTHVYDRDTGTWVEK